MRYIAREIVDDFLPKRFKESLTTVCIEVEADSKPFQPIKTEDILWMWKVGRGHVICLYEWINCDLATRRLHN